VVDQGRLRQMRVCGALIGQWLDRHELACIGL